MRQFDDDLNDLGVVQSASKIWEKMKALRNLDEKEIIKYSRRWIWELLQNAKDVSCENANIKIDWYKNKVIFSHNGRMFTCKDLLSLVTQTSFKEIEQEEATGKFGTGFITTHLLSEKIYIIGYIENYQGTIKKLNFCLDRSGETRPKIQDLVKEQLEQISIINMSDCKEEVVNQDEYSTNFVYYINQNVESIVTKGINELFYCAPYVLAFVPKINSIIIKGNTVTKYNILNIEAENNLYTKYDFGGETDSLIITQYKKIALAVPL